MLPSATICPSNNDKWADIPSVQLQGFAVMVCRVIKAPVAVVCHNVCPGGSHGRFLLSHFQRFSLELIASDPHCPKFFRNSLPIKPNRGLSECRVIITITSHYPKESKVNSRQNFDLQHHIVMLTGSPGGLLQCNRETCVIQSTAPILTWSSLIYTLNRPIVPACIGLLREAMGGTGDKAQNLNDKWSYIFPWASSMCSWLLVICHQFELCRIILMIEEAKYIQLNPIQSLPG